MVNKTNSENCILCDNINFQANKINHDLDNMLTISDNTIKIIKDLNVDLSNTQESNNASDCVKCKQNNHELHKELNRLELQMNQVVEHVNSSKEIVKKINTKVNEPIYKNLLEHIDDVVERLNDSLNGNLSKFKTPGKVYKNLLISMQSNLDKKYIIPDYYTNDVVNKIKKSWEYDSACGFDYITFDYYCNMLQYFGQGIAQDTEEFPHHSEMFHNIDDKSQSRDLKEDIKNNEQNKINYKGKFCIHGVDNGFPELYYSGLKNETEANKSEADSQNNNEVNNQKPYISYTFEKLEVVTENHWNKYFAKIGSVFGSLFKYTLFLLPLWIIFLWYKDICLSCNSWQFVDFKLFDGICCVFVVSLLGYGILSSPVYYWLKTRYQVRLLKKQIDVYPFNAKDFSVEDAPLFLINYDKYKFFQLVNNFYYNYIYNRFLPNFGRIIALDADYGMGKTSFLNLLESKIKYDTMFFSAKHLNIHANIFRNLAFERNIDYVKISITETPEVLSADATAARKKINQLIYRNLDKSFKYYARNMLKSSEVSGGSVKFVWNRFTSIFMSKTKDDIIMSNTRLVLVIEDLDRLYGDELKNAMTNLLFLQNIPMLTAILPVDMKRVDKCFSPPKQSTYIEYIKYQEKLELDRQLLLKIFTAKYPYSGNVREQLAAYYVNEIMPKQSVDGNMLKKYKIDNNEVERIRVQLNLYYQNILTILFKGIEITIREFKKCLAEKSNTNYAPDHFVNSLAILRADDSISRYSFTNWITNKNLGSKGNMINFIGTFMPFLITVLGCNDLYKDAVKDDFIYLVAFVFGVEINNESSLIFETSQMNPFERIIMIKYDIDYLLNTLTESDELYDVLLSIKINIPRK